MPYARLAAARLTDASFILFANSERQEYAPAFDLLRQAGFYRADFRRTGSVDPHTWCTSVLFQSGAGWV